MTGEAVVLAWLKMESMHGTKEWDLCSVNAQLQVCSSQILLPNFPSLLSYSFSLFLHYTPQSDFSSHFDWLL